MVSVSLAILFLSSYGRRDTALSAGVIGLASLLALVGLLIFEWCFVMAGQSVPNS